MNVRRYNPNKFRLYSRDPHINLDRHGYSYLGDFWSETANTGVRGTIRQEVIDFVEAYDANITDVVYWTRSHMWGLPYIFIMVKYGEA